MKLEERTFGTPCSYLIQYAQNRIPFSFKLNYQVVKSFSNETKIWRGRVFWIITKTLFADSSLWLQRLKIVSANWHHLVISYLCIWPTGVVINSQFLPGSDLPYRSYTNVIISSHLSFYRVGPTKKFQTFKALSKPFTSTWQALLQGWCLS